MFSVRLRYQHQHRSLYELKNGINVKFFLDSVTSQRQNRFVTSSDEASEEVSNERARSLSSYLNQQ